MKTQFLVILYLLFSLQVIAQNVNENNVKPVLTSLTVNNVSVSYERYLTENVSLQITPGYFISTPYLLEINDEEYNQSGYSLTIDPRFFFGQQKNAPKGFYFNPFISNSWIKESRDDNIETAEDETDTDKAHLMNFGLSMGHQWIFDSRFVIDLNIGSGYSQLNFDELEPTDNPNLEADTFLPRIYFSLGYNF